MSEVQVSLENGSGLERRMRVQVPAVRIEQEVEARLATAGKTAKLKGFRPGKVPAHVIRQRFGMQIRQEVLQDVVQSSYSEAIVQQKLRPAGSPRIEADAAVSGNDFAYTAVFEVYPEFKVAGLESLAVEKPETEITDSDVDATLERLRRQKGEWKPVEREARTGDRVTVDFTGTRDGVVIEGGKADNVAIVIGDGRMIPDFEAGLVGTRAGAKKSFPVTFPSDYHEESLRSARVSFEVSVHEVAELALPSVDEDFIRGYGVASGELADFRRLIRENLEREAAAKIQAEVRRQVMEHLLGANAIDVPAVMVAREAAGLQAESMRNLGIRDVADAPAAKAYEEVARRRVRLGLIMGAVIREHDIRVEPARIEQKLDELAKPYENPSEVRRLYQQNAELMAQIENSVMEEQVMLWLSGRARVNTKRQTFAELMGV